MTKLTPTSPEILEGDDKPKKWSRTYSRLCTKQTQIVSSGRSRRSWLYANTTPKVKTIRSSTADEEE